MDKLLYVKDSVESQYIICECGDNFPNEKLLNIHLANGHGDLETFQCEACPEIFTSEKLFEQHRNEHKIQKLQKKLSKIPDLKTCTRREHTSQGAVKQERLEDFTSEDRVNRSDEPHTQKPHPKEWTEMNLKTYSKKATLAAFKPDQVQKSPPVIKVNSLKRINSISLIQSLKGNSGLIMVQSPLSPEMILPTVEPEPEPEAVVAENVTETVTDELVIVKSEMEPEEDVNEEIYYQCDVCNTIFNTEADFDVHYQSTHAVKEEATPEKVREENLVSDHIDNVDIKAEMETVETAYYFECEECHKIFASEEYFNKHYNKVHGGLLATLAADQDSEQVEQDQEELTEEKQTVEAEEYVECIETEECKEPPQPKAPEQVVYFKCDLCKVLYPSEKAYNNHWRKKHGAPGFRYIEQDLAAGRGAPPAQDDFRCEFCPKTFPMKRSLQVHRKRVHAEPRAPAGGGGRDDNRVKTEALCVLCGSQFRSLSALNRHISAAEDNTCNTNLRPCLSCGEGFSTEESLIEHLKIHAKDDSVRCEECNRTFTRERSYILHYQRVHLQVKPGQRGGAAVKRVVCEICGRNCNSNASLVYHKRTHTGEKPFQCSECPKRFAVYQLLQIHFRTHTGETPYKCMECPKAFKNKAALNRHNRVHTGAKPYSCQHCGKSFSQSNSMKMHVKTVHLKLPTPYRHRRKKNE